MADPTIVFLPSGPSSDTPSRPHTDLQDLLDEPSGNNFVVKNTFVTLEEDLPSALSHHAASCPADFTGLGPPQLTVLLKNLPSRTTEEKLRSFVEEQNFPQPSMHVPLDKVTGCSKGYAFLRFDEERVAQRFVELAQGAQLAETSAKRLAALFAKKQLGARDLQLPDSVYRALEKHYEDDGSDA